MKTSQLFFKTQKETPADCDIVSHQLMERAGLIKRLGRGLYSYTPLMWKIMKKLMNIIREELDREGCQEVFLPQLQPSDIWKESGRLARYQAENIIYSLQDREEGEYCLGPTHEEVITHLVRNWLTSYKQLPVNLYQIGNKFRDEIRPRFGLMRAKEFMMKDAYAFCANVAQMDEQYEAMRRAYRKIFDRLELRYAIVEADGGAIGKGKSEEFQVIADVGEDAIFVTSTHAANVEALKVKIEQKPYDVEFQESSVVPTEGTDNIEKLCRCLKVKDWQILKTILYRVLYEDREEFVAVCIRGDREVNEVKLTNLLQCLEITLADESHLERIAGVKPGFLGPKDLGVRIIADTECKPMTNFVVATNQNNVHRINANWGRDLELPELHDLMLAREGDTHPVTGEAYKAYRGIEVGHIFNLGDRYSKAMGALFTDETGKSQAMQMGCYGIGVGRLAASVIEQRHDDKGILWPLEIAPFACSIMAVKATDPVQAEITQKVYQELKSIGVDVLWDDRDERLGFKIKDSDLIGIPFKLIVGPKSLESSSIEIEPRTGEKSVIAIDQLSAWANKTFKINK